MSRDVRTIQLCEKTIYPSRWRRLPRWRENVHRARRGYFLTLDGQEQRIPRWLYRMLYRRLYTLRPNGRYMTAVEYRQYLVDAVAQRVAAKAREKQ